MATKHIVKLAIVFFLAFATKASAEMSSGLGIVADSFLPKPTISKNIVLLDVPHIQQDPWLCVPTSSAMILKYFGEEHDPAKLKAAAENYKPKSKRNVQYTLYVDLQHALKQIGKNWRIKLYKKNNSGFNAGWADIKRSLRKGNPVMVDVHLGQGHTFVLIGFNDAEKVVYVRDPDVFEGVSRAIPYSEFKKHWHNHRFARSRMAMFSVPG